MDNTNVKPSIEQIISDIKAEITEELSRAYMYRDYANGLAKAEEIIDAYMESIK